MATALQIVKKYFPQVTSVTDATRGVVVKVTDKDTQSRAVKNHKECAMAVACKRQGADGALIAVKTSYLIKGTKAVRYLNPTSVSREITSFDRNGGFEPGVYHLAAVPQSATIGVRRKWTRGATSKKSMNYHRTENVRVLER